MALLPELCGLAGFAFPWQVSELLPLGMRYLVIWLLECPRYDNQSFLLPCSAC